MQLSVILVNWNGRECIGRCLDSTPEATLGLETEVIVVDNCSTDSSVEFIREYYPRVKVIENQANIGFGRGAQVGIDAAQGEFLAIVNPDVVLSPGSLRQLVQVLEDHPAAALAGPKITQADGTVYSGAYRLETLVDTLRWIPGIARLLVALRPTKTHDSLQRCEMVLGACMVFRASMLGAIGGMPTCTFLYWEEQVLGARFREKGYEVWYDPHCEVAHERGFSCKQRWTADEKAVAHHTAHLAVMRETLSYPQFLAYDFLRLLTLFLGIATWLAGRHRTRPRLALRLMKVCLVAFVQTPTIAPA